MSRIWLHLPLWLRAAGCRLSRHSRGASVSNGNIRVTFCERCGEPFHCEF